MNLNLKHKLELLAEIISYGLDNISLQPADDTLSDTWYAGQFEVLSHQIACCLSQWVTKDSVFTSEILEFFAFDDERKWENGRCTMTQDDILELLKVWIRVN